MREAVCAIGRLCRARPSPRLLWWVAFFATSAGCASAPGRTVTPQDPWERVKRPIYRFNDAMDRAVACPMARAYVRLVPYCARVGIADFFRNPFVRGAYLQRRAYLVADGHLTGQPEPPAEPEALDERDPEPATKRP